METTFAIGESIKFGWEKTKKHFWFFAGVLAVACLAQIVPAGIAGPFKEKAVFIYAILVIAAWVIQALVKMGMIKISLDINDEDKEDFNTLFSNRDLLIKFILGSILYALIVMAGLILLIVPGIIWAIKYQFYAYLIIDKKMDPMEAIKKSGEMTAGNKGKLFGLGILLVLINIGGALFLLVGLFATIPTSMMAVAYVYRKLLGESAIIASPETVESPIAPIEALPQ